MFLFLKWSAVLRHAGFTFGVLDKRNIGRR